MLNIKENLSVSGVRAILIVVFLSGSVALAQEEDDFSAVPDTSIKTAYDLSLEELMHTKVYVASKKLESISEAPASVTIYSSKDMDRMGYYTLRDLSDITSGYSSFRSVGESVFETRGQMSDENNRHLILIDGIPFNHTRANKAPAEEDLPLYFAKRVEFMKGPASALYGISAFSGVISISSKDLDSIGTRVETKVSGGNLDFKKRFMSSVVHKTTEGTSKVAVSIFDKAATNNPLGNGSLINLNSLNRDNQTSIFAYMSHTITTKALSGLGLGVIYSRKRGGLGGYWNAVQNQNYIINELILEEIVPYLKFTKDLSKRLALNTYLKGNISTEFGNVGSYQQVFNGNQPNNISAFNYNIVNYDWEAFGEVNFAINDYSNVIGGINVDSRYNPGHPVSYLYRSPSVTGLTYVQDPSFTRRSSTHQTYSIFGQYQRTLNFLSGTLITVGARLDAGRVIDKETKKLTNNYENLSPRLAIVQKITERFNAKVIYGSALKAPLIKEVSLNEAIVKANPNLAALVPNLKPETLQSLDLAFTYTVTKFNTSLTLFSNRTDDALGTVIKPGVKHVTVNSLGTTAAKGLEYDITYTPNKHLLFSANYSYAKALLSGDSITTSNVPVSKVNAIGTLYIYAPIKLSTTLVWHVVTDYRKGTGTTDQLMDGYNVVDLNVVAKLSGNINIELQVRNLLGTTYYTPIFYDAGVLDIPGAERSFLASLNIKF